MIDFDESWAIALPTCGGGGGLGRDSGFLCLGLWMVSELEGFGMGLGATDASRVGRFFG